MKTKLKILLTTLLTIISVGTMTALAGCNEDSASTPPETGHTHNFTDSITPPTCTEAGYTLHTCACGESYKDSYVNAKGHTANTAVRENEHDSTCQTEGGYDEVVYCSVCNDELSRTPKTIDKKQHTPATAVRENEVDSTCITDGSYDEVVKCSVCKTELNREHHTINANGHTSATAIKENEVDSTCTAEGSYDEVVYCSVCNDELSRTQKEIPAKGHSYTDGICSNCNDDQTKRLLFTENDDGTYSVSKGSADDEHISIPKTYMGKPVMAIAEYAFYNSAIKSVTIPDSITTISNYAFYGCLSLTSITIPDSVTSFGNNAFANCDNLTKLNYKGSLEQWLNIDFASKAANPMSQSGNIYIDDEILTELVIPDGITEIKNYSFGKCLSLTSIKIPASVNHISEYAFRGSCFVESITVDGANATYKSVDNCLIDIANRNLIFGCNNSIIPDDGSVISIGRAFVDCTFTSITIPDTITTIGDDAFRGSKLTSVVIPASVNYIGGYAFSGCFDLKNITFEDTEGWKWLTSTGEQIPVTEAQLADVTTFKTSDFRTYRLIRNK